MTRVSLVFDSLATAAIGRVGWGGGAEKGTGEILSSCFPKVSKQEKGCLLPEIAYCVCLDVIYKTIFLEFCKDRVSQ